MTKKEKIEIIKKILKRYECDQHKLIKLNQQNYYPSIHYQESRQRMYSKENRLLNQIYYKQELINRILLIEQSEAIIGTEYYHLLLEDYLYEHKDWWKQFYSRATYYRRQEKAINAFFDYIIHLL